MKLNMKKYARVPCGSKRIENPTEIQSIKKKLKFYFSLDLAILSLSLVMRFTNGNMIYPFHRYASTKTCTGTAKEVNTAGECHDFSLFADWLIAGISVSVLFDLVSFYQIKQGYVNAFAQGATLLVDFMMFVLAC